VGTGLALTAAAVFMSLCKEVFDIVASEQEERAISESARVPY
jgi:hypothetical protein